MSGPRNAGSSLTDLLKHDTCSHDVICSLCAYFFMAVNSARSFDTFPSHFLFGFLYTLFSCRRLTKNLIALMPCRGMLFSLGCEHINIGCWHRFWLLNQPSNKWTKPKTSFIYFLKYVAPLLWEGDDLKNHIIIIIRQWKLKFRPEWDCYVYSVCFKCKHRKEHMHTQSWCTTHSLA